MTQERWKPVLGYVGIYSVSDYGRVRREHSRTRTKAGRLLKITVSRGYCHVCLYGAGKPRGVRVHRLVYEAFHGPITDGKVVNHRNGDKTDNHLSNLEAVTCAENVAHAFRELGRFRTGEKLTADDALAIRNARAAGDKLRTIASRYGVTEATISAVCTGATWRHIGGPRTPSRQQRATPQAVLSRITDEEVRKIILRYRAGASATALAKEYGVTKRTVYNWLHGHTRDVKAKQSSTLTSGCSSGSYCTKRRLSSTHDRCQII